MRVWTEKGKLEDKLTGRASGLGMDSEGRWDGRCLEIEIEAAGVTDGWMWKG